MVDEDSEPLEKEKKEEALQLIKSFADRQEPFFCHDLKEVMTENG